MRKVLRADKDTYITDRVIRNERQTSSNVGAAGSLDLFKLYGFTASGSTPNVETSRLLVHFDLDPLRDLVSEESIDFGASSFRCTLKLHDVYGGQTTPSGFTVVVNPLSRSFDEGLGRDVVYYADRDVCNYITGSRAQGAWLVSGCLLGGGMPGSVDYVTASVNINAGASLTKSQFFATGEEDLEVDVTTIVSATLAGTLPDSGFRIAFAAAHEADLRTYFVKRFASRTAYDESKRPKLIVTYDDSIQDDGTELYFDSNATLFLYNYDRQALSNLTSGSSSVVGPNSLKLKLVTEISGGTHQLVFSASQHKNGSFNVDGVYSASVYLPLSTPVYTQKLAQSGSVRLVPIWGSNDDTVTFLTGSAIRAFMPQRGGTNMASKRFVVTVHDVQSSYRVNDNATFRVHILDHSSPTIIASRLPVNAPGKIVRDVYYQLRDVTSATVEIPFDVEHGSTKLSSDASGMFFKLDMSDLVAGRSYVIDIMTFTNNQKQVYADASPSFRIKQ